MVAGQEMMTTGQTQPGLPREKRHFAEDTSEKREGVPCRALRAPCPHPSPTQSSQSCDQLNLQIDGAELPQESHSNSRCLGFYK